MENTIQRNHSIDVLRVIASIAVVFIHVSTAPVGSAISAVSGGTLKSLELIHIFMQWSVPVFFMITGFCVMQKENCTYSYCFSKVLKYLGTLFTVGLFYSLLEGVFIARALSFETIINAFISVISGHTWEHMWFVYSIIGVYLVLPIVHCFMKQDNKNIVILTALLLLFNILFPTLNPYLPIGVELPFNGYLVYVCFGSMVAQCNVGKKWETVSIAVIAFCMLYLILRVGKELFVFKHPIVCFMAMGIFLLLSKAEFRRRKIISEIAKCSWGIYLLHPFFMNIALKVLKLDLLSGLLYLKLLLFAIVLFVVSFATTLVLRKIPVIKAIF